MFITFNDYILVLSETDNSIITVLVNGNQVTNGETINSNFVDSSISISFNSDTYEKSVGSSEFTKGEYSCIVSSGSPCSVSGARSIALTIPESLQADLTAEAVGSASPLATSAAVSTEQQLADLIDAAQTTVYINYACLLLLALITVFVIFRGFFKL